MSSPCWTSSPPRASASWCPRCWRLARDRATTLDIAAKHPVCPVHKLCHHGHIKLGYWEQKMRSWYRMELPALRSVCLPTPSSPPRMAWYRPSCASSAPSGCGRPASPGCSGWCWCSLRKQHHCIESNLNVINSTENGHSGLPVWLTGKSHLHFFDQKENETKNP